MSIANELITRGHVVGSRGVDWEADHGVCLLGAAAAMHGVRIVNAESWNDALPPATVDALISAIAAVAPSYAEYRPAAIFAYSDDHSYDEVLRVAKHADEILDAQ